MFPEMGHHFYKDKTQCEIFLILCRGGQLVSPERQTVPTLPPSLIPANLFSSLKVFLLHLG